MYLQITNTGEEEVIIIDFSKVEHFRVDKTHIHVEKTRSGNVYPMHYEREKYTYSFSETPTITDKNQHDVILTYPLSFYEAIDFINTSLKFGEKGVFKIKNLNTKIEHDILFENDCSVHNKIISVFGHASDKEKYTVIKLPF